MTAYRWPSLEEMSKLLSNSKENNSNFISMEKIGTSVKNREIPMVTVTNKSISNEDKEIVLLLAGEHALEKSATSSLLKLLEWLVTDEAKETRDKQIILVIPCVDVDGYEKSISCNANTVDLNMDWSAPGCPSQPETRALLSVMEKYKPEVIVNIHGSGGGGYRPGEEIRMFCSPLECETTMKMGETILQAAEELGYPQGRNGMLEITRPNWYNPPSDSHTTIRQFAYKKFHSLGILVEVGDIEESALARIKALLKIGNSKWSTEYYSGYPNRIMIDFPMGGYYGDNCSLVPYGNTAEKRRNSRVELWQQNIWLRYIRGEEKGWYNLFMYNRIGSWYPMKHGSALRFQLPKGSRVEWITVNGKKVSESEENGYFTWNSPMYTYLQLNLFHQAWPKDSTDVRRGDTFRECIITVKYRPANMSDDKWWTTQKE